MRCPGAELLSASVDGDLSPRRAGRVRAHLEECPACRSVCSELSALKVDLKEAPGPQVPESDWAELAARLQACPTPAPRGVPSYQWALAAAVLCAAIGLGTWSRHRRAETPTDGALIVQAESEFRAADTEYAHALDKLRQVAVRARASWPRARQVEYDAAQAKLEEATERCREVARATPADPRAEALLYDAYRHQIRFFEDQLLRGDRP